MQNMKYNEKTLFQLRVRGKPAAFSRYTRRAAELDALEKGYARPSALGIVLAEDATIDEIECRVYDVDRS